MGLQIKKGKIYTLLTNISRFVLAMVLMVSGFVKAVDPMVWTQCMHNIAARAEEIIREELIYNG